MLTEKDKQFLAYWEKNREQQGQFMSKLLGGLPMAMIFGLPIILSLMVVRLFFPDWYTKISNASNGSFVTVLVAILILVFCYSFFRMQYKWELNEQLFAEIKAKEKKQHQLQEENKL